MQHLNIKALFSLFVVLLSLLFSLYTFVNYEELKAQKTELLEQKALNRALFVSKKITELHDRVAYQYSKYTHALKASMQLAQEYFKENGFDAPLEKLQKKLNAQREGFEYDIYLINKDYIIDRTTFQKDLYLDFHILPEALKVLEKTYENAGSIDISIPRNDPFSHRYKNYILQKMPDKEYLLQLSLSVNNVESIDSFVHKMQKNVPNLLTSDIFILYKNSPVEYSVDYAWKQEYQKSAKKKMLRSKKNYDTFIALFNPQKDLKGEELHKALEYFLHQKGYKSYFQDENGKKIYKILLPYSAYLSFSEYGVYVLYLKFDVSNFQAELDTLFYNSFVTWMLFFALVGVLLYFVNIRLIEPLIALQKLMKEKKMVESKDMLSRGDEITSISLIYNQLLKDLYREIESNEALLEEFKTFTANSIHQARTPLSVIKIALEMIESENREALMQIESSVVSIEHLYDTLSLSILENSVEFKVERLNLSQILQERVEFFRVVAQAHDKELRLNTREDIYIEISKEELEFLVDNNLSNALKYSPPHTDIEIMLSSSDDEVILSFKNRGKEIADKEAIFQRYFRNDKSRRGTGIGLSIVDGICKKYAILVQVYSANGINEFLYYFKRANVTQK